MNAFPRLIRLSLIAITGSSLLIMSACKTKAEIRREQEVERLKSDLTAVKGDRADIETISEELKGEIARLSNLIEERAVTNKQQIDEIRKEMSALGNRLEAVEGRISQEDSAERQRVSEKAKASFDLGKKYYDDGKYEEAADVLKTVSRSKDRPDDARKALYWLAESYYANKEFASAAIQFAEFKKDYPKDNLIPQAIYKQANAFRSMNKPKEAKLFYQELVDKFPRHPLAKKGKVEMKKLK
jgi:TolA-binding protein